jgi:hemerythrin-like domain-containing protein
MKCTDLLIQDHKIVLRALDVLEQMAKRVENHQVLEHDDVATLLRFLRSFADDYHQGKEESALFPELRRFSTAPDGPLRQMLFEHDQERSLVEAIEDALFTKKGFEFVHFAHRLIDLMRDHVRKEDRVLFEIVDRSLSKEQDENVVDQFNRFNLDPLLMFEFRTLESKYTKKAAA